MRPAGRRRRGRDGSSEAHHGTDFIFTIIGFCHLIPVAAIVIEAPNPLDTGTTIQRSSPIRWKLWRRLDDKERGIVEYSTHPEVLNQYKTVKKSKHN